MANEIRQLYCELSALKRYQAIMLSHTSGLLAAQGLKLPLCSRTIGNGNMLILQQCEPVTVFLSAKLTSCGYEPFVQINSTNYTIGKDGFSLHPFQECLWPLPYVSIQKNDYTWANGEWKKINGSLHISKLELVSRFSDVLLKTYDYLPRHHSIYDNGVEQMNVMSELISHMQISNTNSLSTINARFTIN